MTLRRRYRGTAIALPITRDGRLDEPAVIRQVVAAFGSAELDLALVWANTEIDLARRAIREHRNAERTTA